MKTILKTSFKISQRLPIESHTGNAEPNPNSPPAQICDPKRRRRDMRNKNEFEYSTRKKDKAKNKRRHSPLPIHDQITDD